MEEKIEWVEIVEPKTGEHMFANLRTGQCLWEAPPGVNVKKTHDNQWWQLYDLTTRKYYYYNATSQRTVWRRPNDGDIIPLAKLQQLKAKESSPRTSSTSSGSGTTDSNNINNKNRNHDTMKPNETFTPESGFVNNNANIDLDSSSRVVANTSVMRKDSAKELDDSAASNFSRSAAETLKTELDAGKRHGEITRTSSTGDAEDAAFVANSSLQLSNKLKSKSFKPKRPAPPKPPRGNIRTGSPGGDISIVSDSDSHESPERGLTSAVKYPKPDYDTKLSMDHIKSQKHDGAEHDATHLRNSDVGSDVADGIVLANAPKRKGKSLKPSRLPPSTPRGDGENLAATIPPTPPPVPPVKLQTPAKRALPRIEYDSDSSRDSAEIKSPFSKMMDEMHEYNEHLEPSSSTDEATSPSGTLLPESKSGKFSLYENVGQMRMKPVDEESSNAGSNDCFAERLTNMGMPACTAALVDACDASRPAVASSSSASPNALSRNEQDGKALARMHSDSAYVTRKTSSPVNGEQKQPIAFRPASMMPSTGRSRDHKDGAHPRPTLMGNAEATSSLAKKVPLSTHHKGFIRRKRVSIASMLSWSKSPIKKPMVLTRDKQLRKEAVDIFKLSLHYMGDKSSRKSSATLALEIVSKGWSMPGLRDEIYIQLCKQTTANERSTSLEKGWELITVCLAMFPPSNKFHSYLEGYIYRHLEPEHDELGVPVSKYAKHCYKQLERICRSGAKRGLKKPTIDEIEQAKESVFHPSLFGNTLEEIMEMQQEHYPDRMLPWIMTTLADFVLSHNGLRTEGIFRVPGDIDEVNSLKVQIDKWKEPTTVRDPHIPASLLKLWFRDLYEPLIPNIFYERCIRNCDNAEVAISIVNALPGLNRLVFCFLIRFLQGFMSPEVSSISKMGEDNLAMVWAPNCLRCPSEDHLQIFENTRKEMTFLRTLMQNLNTSFLEDVL